MRTILVHYLAFHSDLLFVFTPGAGPWPTDAKETDILEYVFRQCNHVDDTEWIANKKLRSLSVGDVVILIDGEIVTRYRCDSAGWTKLSNIP